MYSFSLFNKDLLSPIKDELSQVEDDLHHADEGETQSFSLPPHAWSDRDCKTKITSSQPSRTQVGLTLGISLQFVCLSGKRNKNINILRMRMCSSEPGACGVTVCPIPLISGPEKGKKANRRPVG